MGNLDRELLEYQPDAAAIEAGGVPGGARWVLYVILAAIVALVVGAIVFRVVAFRVSDQPFKKGS